MLLLVNNTVSIVIGILALLFVLARQLQKRPVREDRGMRFMLILAVVGLYEIGTYLAHHSAHATAIGIVAGSLVVAAVFGAIRAYTVRLWREDGVLYRQGNALTLLLWLVAIGAHFGLDILVDHSGGGSGLASSALVLYIAVSLGVQRLVVGRRATRLPIAAV